MVARDENHVLAGDRLELLLRERVLVGIAVVREVAGHDDDVRLGRVDLADRRLQQLLAVAGAADVDVRELRDQHGAEV